MITNQRVVGSNPTGETDYICPCGEIGKRNGLKPRRLGLQVQLLSGALFKMLKLSQRFNLFCFINIYVVSLLLKLDKTIKMLNIITIKRTAMVGDTFPSGGSIIV